MTTAPSPKAEPVGPRRLREGLAGLIEACQAKVRAFIAKRAPAAEVDDIFQEAVGNLLAADRVDPVESVGAWLFRAVKNELIDRGRKIKEIPWPDWETDSEMSEVYELMERPGENPEEEYLKDLFWREFFEALGELPEKQREAFVRTEIEGLAFKELAAQTGENVNALLARKRKARLFLRERLKDLYDLLVRF